MKDIYLKRRKFINDTVLLLGSTLLPVSAANAFSVVDSSRGIGVDKGKNKSDNNYLDFTTIPNFCTHEHWGSISSIGMAPAQGGFRCDTTTGAQPLKPTSIWDLVLEPYQNGWMHAIGDHHEVKVLKSDLLNLPYEQLWKTSPAQALVKFKSKNNPLVLTGGFQCTRRGILHLYGIDINKFDVEQWKVVDQMIEKNYSDLFSWYEKAMRKAFFSELIRPVHPEYYVQEESTVSKVKELAITHNIMRIDPLLDLWSEINTRRDALAKIVGIDPVDANTWRAFIQKLFDLAAENHSVGIKQLQAYRRSLLYLPHKDAEVTFRGKLDQDNIIKFQDWVMHECCKQANERNWIHQVHVGTNNITESSPMPLQSLAIRYPKMNIVMIHCWPFLKEAGWLAKFLPNVYIDTCWLPVLNPEFLREGLNMWLNYVPTHKIMLAHDSTTIEMAVGSSLFTREILSETLGSQQKALKMSNQATRLYAADLLQNNAVRLYRFGTEVTG